MDIKSYEIDILIETLHKMSFLIHKLTSSFYLIPFFTTFINLILVIYVLSFPFNYVLGKVSPQNHPISDEKLDKIVV